MIPFWNLLFRASTERRLRISDRFLRVADAVSAGMGTPANIIAWAILVVAWTTLFIVCPELQNDTTFLPSWFTSNAYNFPLNTVTTLAELFIGFLIAAAANRVEKRNYELHMKMTAMLEHLERLGQAEKDELDEIKASLHVEPPA